MKRYTATNFLSGLGKHNIQSIGKDMGLGDLLKKAPKFDAANINSKDFGTHCKTILNTDILADIGIRTVTGVAIKMIANGNNPLTNKNMGMSSNQKTPMGKKSATYQVTQVHIGIPATKRLKRMQYNPNVDYDEKVIASNQPHQNVTIRV